MFHELFPLVLGFQASHPPLPQYRAEYITWERCNSNLARGTPGWENPRVYNVQSYVFAAYAYLFTMYQPPISRPDPAGPQGPWGPVLWERVEFFTGQATYGVGQGRDYNWYAVDENLAKRVFGEPNGTSMTGPQDHAKAPGTFVDATSYMSPGRH